MKLEDLKQLVPSAEVVELREDATYLIVVNGETVPMVTLEGLVKWITEQPIRVCLLRVAGDDAVKVFELPGAETVQ